MIYIVVNLCIDFSVKNKALNAVMPDDCENQTFQELGQADARVGCASPRSFGGSLDQSMFSTVPGQKRPEYPNRWGIWGVY